MGVKATLYDGSYHPVDSSDMAFKTAASLAFKKLADVAGPAILEPIGTLNAYMPDDNLGDIMGDITKRRGRVLGMGPETSPECRNLKPKFLWEKWAISLLFSDPLLRAEAHSTSLLCAMKELRKT